MTIAQFEALRTARVDGGTNLVAGERVLWDKIRSMTCFIGEIKEMDVDTSFITTYFDVTGLGLVDTQYEGWAIMNGNNGTSNDGGLVSIGYHASTYPTLGATGGEKDHTLIVSEIPAHTHGIKTVNKNAAGSGSERTVSSTGAGTEATESIGGGLAHNNMQPYRVHLKIKRIA